MATIQSNNNVGCVRGFGSSGDGVTISGNKNNLQVNSFTAGGDALVVSGDNNQVSIQTDGNVSISGDKNTVIGVIEGTLTFETGTVGNIVLGKVIGAITDNGSSNNVANVTT